MYGFLLSETISGKSIEKSIYDSSKVYVQDVPYIVQALAAVKYTDFWKEILKMERQTDQNG